MTGSGRRARVSGAPQERTVLAWTRTCLSYLACALLCARLAVRAALPARYVALAGIAATMTLLGTAILRERRRAAALASGDPIPVPVEAAVLTVMTVGLAGTAIALIVVSG